MFIVDSFAHAGLLDSLLLSFEKCTQTFILQIRVQTRGSFI